MAARSASYVPLLLLLSWPHLVPASRLSASRKSPVDASAAALPAQAEALPLAWLCLGVPRTERDYSEQAPRHEGHIDTSLISYEMVESGISMKVNETAKQAAAASSAGKAAEGAKHKLTPRSWFTMTLSFAFIVKALCMLSNVLFQVSPIPQVRQFSKQQDTGEADAAPFISILYGGCQWCFYGLFAFLVTKKSGFLVLVYSNIAGAFLGIYYVYGFQCNCRNSKSRRMLFTYYKIVSSLALLQAIAMALLERQQALFFSGLVSSICSVVGACSLIATLPTVLETGCSASINVPLLSVGIASGFLWLACGFILWDAWIVVPNLICMFIQFVAVSVVLYFPRELPTVGARTAPVVDGEQPQTGSTWTPAPAPTGTPTLRAVTQGYGTFRVLGETGGTF